MIFQNGDVLLSALALPVLVCYGVMSLLCFIAFAGDKAAARRGLWRSSERSLLWWAFCCGWPGALLAQRLLRHKSQKRSFRRVLWLAIIANCGVLIAVLYYAASLL